MASTFRSSLCALCSSPPVYTCPRCSLQTCSLPCIKTHKLKYSCSGERDPTAYIPLRDVGQGVWADDYRWLEEGRRKVASWGEGLPRDAVVSGGRGRGGRGGRQRLRVTRGKMDILGMELRRRGCEVKFMPEGMGRRKLNQSSWNPRTQMLHLTVQFVVPVVVIQPEHPKVREMKTITRPRVVFSEPDTESIPNLASLLPSPVHTDDLVFVLPFQPSPGRLPPEVPLSKRQKLFFPPLKPTSTLAEVLRGTAWVEFPTFHIVPRTEWEDGKRKGEIVVVPLNEPVLDEPGASGRLRDSGWGAKRKATVEMPVRLEKKAKMMPDLRLAALEEYESASDDEGSEKEDGEIHEPVGRSVTGTGSIRGDDEP